MNRTWAPPLRIGVAGLGAIGGSLVRALVETAWPEVVLVGAADETPAGAAKRLATLGLADVPAMDLADLIEACDLVVEAAPAAAFRSVAEPVLASDRILLAMSVGALLENWDLVEQAKARGGLILAPSGALAGLDAVRAAAALGGFESVTLVSRKPPAGLAGATYLAAQGIDLTGLEAPLRVFTGDAREAARAFPANANVAAALALAGPGPEQVAVEIWADPGVSRNIHMVELRCSLGEITTVVCAKPTAENPRSSRIAIASALAVLRRITARVQVGA